MGDRIKGYLSLIRECVQTHFSTRTLPRSMIPEKKVLLKAATVKNTLDGQ
jgi:hypothetical protein